MISAAKMGLPFDPFEALHSILENRRTISMDVPVIHLGDHSYRFGISGEWVTISQSARKS